MRRGVAPFSAISTCDFGNVPKSSTSSESTVRFYNNYSGSSAVSDAEDCVLTTRSSDGSIGNGGAERSPGYGDQIVLENWTQVKNIAASSTYDPVTEVIDEVIGIGDGVDTTFDITYGSTASGTQVPNNPDSEGDSNPCIVVRKSVYDNTASNAVKTAESWEWALDSDVKSPIVKVTGLSDVPNGAYNVTNATFYEDTVTLDSTQNVGVTPPAGGTDATLSYYYNTTLTYTTDFTYANGVANGVVTLVVAPVLDQELECDYLFRSPDSSFITVPDDTATTAGDAEDGHEIGGRCTRGDITDSSQDKDASVGATTAGSTNFKNVIKDAYSTLDGTTSCGFAEVKIRVAVPADGVAGQESFIARLVYSHI